MTETSTEPVADLRAWIAVVAGTIGAAMVTLDTSITTSSLPQIQGEIGATISEGTWIMTGYLAAEIVVIPMSAWLTRLLGLRRLLITAVVLFVGFSLLCALSTNLTEMIAFRVGQGLTGAALIPSAQTIIMTVLPRSKQLAGFALFTTGAMITPSLGPVIGGWITDNLGWPYLFILNVPIGIALIVMLLATLSRAPAQLAELRNADWIGLAMLTVSLACFTVVLEEGQREAWFDSDLITRLSVVSAVAFAILISVERRHRNPVVRLSLLTDSSFGASLLISFIFGAILYFGVFFGPAFLGTIAHYDSQQIGMAMLSLNGASMLATPIAPALQNRLGSRTTIALGLFLLGTGCLMNIDITALSDGDALFWPHVVRGIGLSFVFIPLTQVAMATIGPESAADASGLFNMVRNLGGSVGLALTAVIIDRRSVFHFQMISEQVTGNSRLLWDRLQGVGAVLGASGSDAAYGQAQSMAALRGRIAEQGLVMAYADSLWLFGIALFLCIGTVFLLRKPGSSAPQMAH
ncbi:MAG TPA: DHA2 family efflux MFS transporter permease subunit [Alphaproteobacteria bacterium]|nr:DHA2 family efflux MFS transporter permease subunit [Alphaproteobacteria bacterium]